VGVVGLLLALTACGDNTGRSQSPPTRTYEVRGIVRQIQLGTEGHSRITIHHEAIPDFVGIDGQQQVMKAMTMPFAVAESVDLTGLAPGTMIRFELTVDWNAAEPGRITSLEPLPADTVLDFENPAAESNR